MCHVRVPSTGERHYIVVHVALTLLIGRKWDRATLRTELVTVGRSYPTWIFVWLDNRHYTPFLGTSTSRGSSSTLTPGKGRHRWIGNDTHFLNINDARGIVYDEVG